MSEDKRTIKTLKDTSYFAQGSYKRQFLEALTVAGVANILTKTLLAPLQRYQIIRQTQLGHQLRPNKIFSFYSYLSKFRKEQGKKSLWRGNTANCWLSFWQILLQVGIYDSIKQFWHDIALGFDNDPFFKFVVDRLFSPLMASSIGLALTYPIDTARIRISMNYFRNPKQMLFHNILSCLSLQKLEERSIKGLYRGYLFATLVSVVNLNFYVTLRDLWRNLEVNDTEYWYLKMLTSGEFISSFLSLMAIYPLDTIKKNVQLNNHSRPVVFKNARQAFSFYKNQHSIKTLYSGMTVSTLKQIIYWPVCMLLIESIKEVKRDVMA